MADFDNVQAIRGDKLSDLVGVHVANALAVTLKDEYQVSTMAMESYDFVPYALTGLSAAMQTPEEGSPRASTEVSLPIYDDKGGIATAKQTVTLFGPGDVLGIDPGQIVRRYPPPGCTNAEETFHAHIEFDRPELPWAFSAHGRGDQLPAWIALVVFEREEVEWQPAQAGLPPAILVKAKLLPPLDTAWAWAHAQATSGGATLSARLSTAYAQFNLSRLLAARVLKQDTNYLACLVPTTAAGRNAGLGWPPPDDNPRGPAWPQNGDVILPVYDRWEFRTGPDGDFARLARRLIGVDAPWEIGRRTMDTAHPGAPLPDLGLNDDGRRQVIKCALFSPAPGPPGSVWSGAQRAALKDALDLPARLEGTAGIDPGMVPNLPIVGPRIYAKGQRGTGTISGDTWFAELNLAPVQRVAAGLGTRVVAKDQEPLMQAAWAQVGDIEKANRALVLAEVARNLTHALHKRLGKVDPGRLLQMTRPLAARVRLDGTELTLAGQTVRSATPTAALGGAFRRVVRATGSMARRLNATERASLTGLVASGDAFRDFALPYANPDGIGGLSAVAIKSLNARAVARALQTSPARALETVTAASRTLARTQTLATALTTPNAWKDPDVSFQPGMRIADKLRGDPRWNDVVERAGQVTVTDVRDHLTALIETPGALALGLTPHRDVLVVRKEDLLRRLDPDRTVIDTMRARLNLGLLTFDAFKLSLIRPLMAAPRFDRPMYQALDAYDRDWLVPGLGNLPEPEMVTLLSTNDEFTEAFLIGLSDEMGRELLWRGYPTDARGTYFHRFWKPNEDELTQEIHRFTSSRLGSHVHMGPGESGLAVVVIRGEVVRRYPDMTVMAMQSNKDENSTPDRPNLDGSIAVESLFHAMLSPDIMLVGLNITTDKLKAGGWWIVLAEHPQATRFRRSEEDDVIFSSPGALVTGALVAEKRLGNPTRIAFKASDFF